MIVAEQTVALQSPDCYATVGQLSNNLNFEQKWQNFQRAQPETHKDDDDDDDDDDYVAY